MGHTIPMSMISTQKFPSKATHSDPVQPLKEPKRRAWRLQTQYSFKGWSLPSFTPSCSRVGAEGRAGASQTSGYKSLIPAINPTLAINQVGSKCDSKQIDPAKSF